MATVTQCDSCKAVMKHNESKYVEIYSVTSNNTKCKQLHLLDLCESCYLHLLDALGLTEEGKR